MSPRPPQSTSPHHPTITPLLNNHFRSSTLFPKPVFQTNPTTFKMAFFKSLIIASVAAVALAQGASDKNTKVDVDSQSSGAKCGNGQKIACCNSGEDLIGLNCLSIPIRMFTALRSIRFGLRIFELTIDEQSPSPSSRLAVPTSLLAARLVTPT